MATGIRGTPTPPPPRIDAEVWTSLISSFSAFRSSITMCTTSLLTPIGAEGSQDASHTERTRGRAA